MHSDHQAELAAHQGADASRSPPRHRFNGNGRTARVTRGHGAPAHADADRRDGRALVSVVFSFWNEEDVLPELIRRTRAVFEGLIAAGQVGGYELIFVNDASTDSSEDILRQAADERGDICIVNMSRNFGVSPCVLAGMQFARGDAVVYMDADLQDPPEIIPQMIHAWKADAEVQVVHTVRHSRRGETRIKRALTSLGYTALRAVSQIDLPREAGDFKLLSRRVVDQLVQFREKRPFLRGLVCWLGYRQAIVYYDRAPRFSGKSKFPVLGFKVLRNFFDSALIAFSDVPLRLAVWAGLAMLMGGILLLALLVARAAAGQETIAWQPTTLAVLLVGGVQLVCVGILGRYLSAVFWEAKQRPNFIIKDTYGFDRAAMDRRTIHAEQENGEHPDR
jgi:glycosyltransferase involved in cell wall biosynthesis